MIQDHVLIQCYVSVVLEMYTALPETPVQARPADRKLAEDWRRNGITLDVVESALLLAQLRRLARPPDYPKLAPIRSLYYFVPIVEEVMEKPLPEGYVEYMKSKLQKWSTGNLGSTSTARSHTGA
jgi:hypothetical protein